MMPALCFWGGPWFSNLGGATWCDCRPKMVIPVCRPQDDWRGLSNHRAATIRSDSRYFWPQNERDGTQNHLVEQFSSRRPVISPCRIGFGYSRSGDAVNVVHGTMLQMRVWRGARALTPDIGPKSTPVCRRARSKRGSRAYVCRECLHAGYASMVSAAGFGAAP